MTELGFRTSLFAVPLFPPGACRPGFESQSRKTPEVIGSSGFSPAPALQTSPESDVLPHKFLFVVQSVAQTT